MRKEMKTNTDGIQLFMDLDQKTGLTNISIVSPGGGERWKRKRRSRIFAFFQLDLGSSSRDRVLEILGNMIFHFALWPRIRLLRYNLTSEYADMLRPLFEGFEMLLFQILSKTQLVGCKYLTYEGNQSKIAEYCHCYSSIIKKKACNLCHLCRIHLLVPLRRIWVFRLNVEFNFQNKSALNIDVDQCLAIFQKDLPIPS